MGLECMPEADEKSIREQKEAGASRYSKALIQRIKRLETALNTVEAFFFAGLWVGSFFILQSIKPFASFDAVWLFAAMPAFLLTRFIFWMITKRTS